MTLGGLALAVGIVVDDNDRGLENVHRNASQGKGLIAAHLMAAQQDRDTALVSTPWRSLLVFLAVVLLTGPAKFSSHRWPSPWSSPSWPPTSCRGSTIIPTLCALCLPMQLAQHETRGTDVPASPHLFSRLSHTPSPRGSSASGSAISQHWRCSLAHRARVCVAFGACARSRPLLVPPFVGRTSVPTWMPTAPAARE